jgi:hypothetical protein
MALIHQHDAAFIDVTGQRVALDLHVLRRCDQDVIAPEPAFFAAAVVADDAVADDRRKRDIVKDPGAAVAFGDVVLIDDVAAFDVTPQACAAVVMHVVAAQDDAFAGRQFDAAGFPTGQEFAVIVLPTVVGELDTSGDVIEVEPAWTYVVLREHLNERNVVDEQAFGQIASRALPLRTPRVLVPAVADCVRFNNCCPGRIA